MQEHARIVNILERMNTMQELNAALDHVTTAQIEAGAAKDQLVEAQRCVEERTQAFIAACDTSIETFANVLSEAPVGMLTAVSAKDLQRVWLNVYYVDVLRIYDDVDRSRILPGANQFYVYEYPNSSTATLWAAFRKSAETLGFNVRNTYNLTYRERSGELHRVTTNVTILDMGVAKHHENIFLKLLSVFQELPIPNTVLRVHSIDKTIAEYKETGSGIDLWMLYEDSIKVLSETGFYNTRDGVKNPLDFL